MVAMIVQAVETGIEAVENGVGGCVLGAGLTAAAVYGGFHLAGYHLGLTCQRRLKRKKDDSPYDAKSADELDAEREYAATHSRWTTANLRKQTQEKELEADQAELDVERLKEKRRAFQEERVRELDAIREARKAEKAAAEQTAVADAPEAAKQDKKGAAA